LKILNLAIIVSLLGIQSGAQAATFEQWAQALKAAPGVFSELSKFQGLPSEYIQEFPGFMKNKMINEMQTAIQPLIQKQSCQPRINVQFLKSVSPMAANYPAVANFESQFIRIELISCLSQSRASNVAATYLSNEYQKRAFDTVVFSEQRGASVCQRTQTTGLGMSEYCYTNQKLELPGTIYINSFNESNREQVAVPVYFREILSAAVDLPSGTLFYSSVYVRSVNFSGFMKTFAKSIISDSQSKAIEVLAEMSK
jgi:hypothetical protein